MQHENENKNMNRSFIGVMQHRTNDLVKFMELKHRFWRMFNRSMTKSNLQQVRNLFRSDHPCYLFRYFDNASDDRQSQILALVVPYFFTGPATMSGQPQPLSNSQ